MRWFGSIAVVALVAAPFPATAEVYRLKAPDGTVHFTNAPTDMDPLFEYGNVTAIPHARWFRLGLKYHF